MSIGLKEIRSAREAIASSVDRTPLVASRSLSLRAGLPVYLKLENLQKTGSFKIRGAANRLSLLTAAERRRGVIAASAGKSCPGGGPRRADPACRFHDCHAGRGFPRKTGGDPFLWRKDHY
ncbi:MAG: pyridoxal-phosphate dependent enzyme [Candidatus Manganitrophus sp.]|nr:pyridoxal-phosphate dependent enzyme [Candidatus Manganitrophus sp.]